jgi:hypothetical protein
MIFKYKQKFIANKDKINGTTTLHYLKKKVNKKY